MVSAAQLPVEPAEFGEAQGLDAAGAVALDIRSFSVINSREEAEFLVMLDHTNGRDDTEWTAYFVESMVEFLVWRSQPWGNIGESDLDWFLAVTSDAPSPSVPALLFALIREIGDVPERLTALAMKLAKNRLALFEQAA